MCGTSNALQMDCTALEDELCEGPNIATTPKDSWSQAREEQDKKTTKKTVCSTEYRQHCDHYQTNTDIFVVLTDQILVFIHTLITIHE